ncbi:MAG TPA: polyphenol oxidase family protein [Thermoanaerobaculia bacterium]|nr:polyphenol oxidase family protein [Thermoanaerobaculia bacterium]
MSWLKQTHSADVLLAAPGACGEGDALWSDRSDLALAITTADCVPVLLAGAGCVAAIHAGWRGIVGNIVLHAIARLPVASERLRAWIGPAIGPCCYEVGEDVAHAVETAAGSPVIHPGRAARPHLDLVAAVEAQLHARGVTAIERLSPCTRCNAESWHSYRRDGAAAGRNWAFLWRAS